MKRFKNILLVHEQGKRGRKARERAVGLARRNGARLTILEVGEPLSVGDNTYQTPDGEIDLRDLVAAEREAELAEVVEEISAEGVAAEARVVLGDRFMSIMHEIHARRHDLVLLTSEGDGGLKDHLFGSTSRHLLRKCPCPVWIVRPTRRRKTYRVLAAINPGENEARDENLVRTILEMSTSLARMYDGELDVAHVWQPAPTSGRVPRKVVEGWNRELAEQAEERLTATLADFDLSGMTVRLHTPGGPPGKRLAEIAERRRSDVIVMGTLSRTGLQGLLVGNTAETVLQHINASVLAVKPADFVSPIRFDDD